MADRREDDYISSLSGSQMDAALMDMAEHNSEAWAVGERNGIDVSNIDPTYQNNAKYYAEQAARVVPTSGVPAVRYDTPQVLRDTEKQTVRNNIDAPNPTELLDLKMLGWTVPKDSPIQNFKDDNGVYHQRVGRVDLGSLTWNYLDAHQLFYTDDFRTPLYNNQTLGYCYKYAVTTAAFDVMSDKSISTWWQNFSTNFRVLLKDLSFSNPALLKASLQGVYLYYELASEIARPIDGGELVARHSNPNLLDNPFFTVNQRGATSYPSNVYAIDRWKSTVNGQPITNTVVVANDNIKINSGSNTITLLMQILEDDLIRAIDGQNVTASAIINGVLYSTTFNYSTTDLHRYKPSDDFEIMCGGTQNYFTIWLYGASKSITIKAVKLELGSVSTLANDSVPNYATELLKCQRFFVRLMGDNAVLGIGHTTSATGGRMLIPTPVSMRAKPTSAILGGSGWAVICNGVQSAITAISVSAYAANGVTLGITSSGLADNRVMTMRLSSSTAYIDISADL